MRETTATEWMNTGLRWWEKPTEREERLDRILACLRQDARMPLAEISRRTKVPISTVFDCVRRIEDRFWFTAVFLDARAEQVRATVMTRPTARHRDLVEVVI